jgi:Na+(H+)/acetate symporter ActP
MHLDPYVLSFSALTVVATIWLGFWAARKSKTAHDFYVAGRSVSVGWNASAISGEYLSAASFMGVAGMVMSSGYDALWYPVCYACGYLFLLLFIAGPLRRFGAYTIPDFAEGRYDSPVFRKIAVVFVLFIGFFYTMPQMKGAGTTLAYIFPGLPYWAGVVLVGAVITLNVALGGMKGITLVQAFQYWAKMFAISVPVFVLMGVYGHYGKQLARNGATLPDFRQTPEFQSRFYGFTRNNHRSIQEIVPALKSNSSVKGKAETVIGWLADSPSADGMKTITILEAIGGYNWAVGETVWVETTLTNSWKARKQNPTFGKVRTRRQAQQDAEGFLSAEGISLIKMSDGEAIAIPQNESDSYRKLFKQWSVSVAPPPKALPEKAPKDVTWVSPFGPLTTKAAKAAAASLTNQAEFIGKLPLRPDLPPDKRMTVNLGETNVVTALGMYAELTGRVLLPRTTSVVERMDDFFGGRLSRWHWITRRASPGSGIVYHRDGMFSAQEVKERLESLFQTNGILVMPEGEKCLRALPAPISGERTNAGAIWQKVWLQSHERPLALLYTYSLIIALVCGTAGLPHILVRFYTNPDGVAAKRTTMWVMIFIGVFYLFPPIFGVLGRNLLPELYGGAGAKGTDKIVLELPRLLNERYAPLGSVLSGITCAGAFAAFMSTFSGLLVSMTGALAHDVYGRMLRPKSTPDQRMKAFKVCAVAVGAVAIVLGMQVEPFQINFMVGQAFAIAAASYFPLLFMSAWWRGMTMKGAATGMLTGGLLALAGISLTSFTDLKWLPLDAFWAAHPLLRILCEQPAIWAVPLAIALMVVVSKLTRKEVPADVRMKMLVLHAPEKLGLKGEYIREHGVK